MLKQENLKFPGSLHNHTDSSNFRLRDSINRVETLIDRAIELEHEVLAITEHETVASAVKAEKYYNKIRKDNPNFKLILGNEIYLCRDGLNASNFVSGKDQYFHFILLAKDAIGHEQIREISTRAWMRSYMARGMMRVPTYYNDLYEIIGKNPGHVIGQTACIGGALGQQLLNFRKSQDNNLYEKIKIWCRQLKDLFGDGNFYLEMQPSFNDEQIYVNKNIVSLSKELDIPYVITTDSHYLKKEDIFIHKAFLNAQGGERETESFYATTYLMTDEEIHEYMSESLGEEVLQSAFHNILKIKDSCEDYSLLKPLKIPKLKWKSYPEVLNQQKYIQLIPSLENFFKSQYEEDRLLAKAVVHRILNDETLQNKEAYEEIDACLEDTWVSSEVNNSRWSAYFLNLQNIIEICWEAGTLVGPGRGSGVGFILLYLLDITQINPLREKTKVFRWRFLNPERVSVLDVDIDIEGGRRNKVLKAFRDRYGEDRVANVLTVGTEKARSAIQTAARGLGIDNDIAQYLSSMVVSDRGQQRTLAQTFYGDEENGFKPNREFRHEMEDNYPELWRVAQSIEGLICRTGIHAGGVIFVDEPFYKTSALMRAPSGEIITQFDLHDAEDLSLIKYDILSVEALDRIHNCVDLLCDYGYADRKDSLKKTYESILNIYSLERTDPEMWKMCWEHKVLSLFQMEKQSGIQGIALMKPSSVDDLAILNSTIRLMAQERGAEMPTEKLTRFKNNPEAWDAELRQYGLGEDAKRILEPVVGISYGLCIAQEQFMQLVQLPELGGFSLTWADKLRKSIAKKNPKDYEALSKEFYKITEEKGCDRKLCHYAWDVLIAMSKGYGFNQSHTLAYSLIGLQELNLAYRYPIIFWNCACLIADSGGTEEDEEEEVDEVEDEDEEDTSTTKKKKKTKATNFGKIATAIGKMNMEGIKIYPPDINKSSFTFAPDVDNNIIRYGLKGISKINKDKVNEIIIGRPYSSIRDFLNKIKVTKPQMINLIKSGAFDEFGDRTELMRQYAASISDTKKRVTLQNMKMLIDFDLLPNDFDWHKKVYNFNKYIKKSKIGDFYGLDNYAFAFFNRNYSIDLLVNIDSESGFGIKQALWDRLYKKEMNTVREYIKSHQQELLDSLNNRLMSNVWNKYCAGSISKWEMDSISFYYHDHELSKIKNELYGLVNFFNLSEESEIDYTFSTKEGRTIPIYKIHRIAGTILDKNKDKNEITLLTTTGVVTVKIFGQVFSHYDRQISEKGSDGKKHVIEKSWLSRGNKIIVTGMRRGDQFVGKKYKRTPYHLIELITDIDDNGRLRTQTERVIEEEE